MAIQSMTNTLTADIEGTVSQVKSLADAGSDLVRITVDTEEAAAAEWRKRLEKSLAKRAALGIAAAYAQRAMEGIADLPPPGLT